MQNANRTCVNSPFPLAIFPMPATFKYDPVIFIAGPAIIEAVKVIYYPVPKCAGTSVRACLFEIENGFPWRDFTINGRKKELYQFLAVPRPFKPKTLPAPTWERIAVVRDPVERFLSMYRNRVLHYGDADKSKRGQRYLDADLTRMRKLPRMPDLETFVANLAEYRKIFRIWHHTNPQTYFLGHDIGYYQRVFRLDHLGELTAYLSQRAGRPVELPHLRNQGPQVGPKKEISRYTLEGITDFYRADYEFLHDIYDPPSTESGR